MLHTLFFVLYSSSFILHPLFFILYSSYFILPALFFLLYSSSLILQPSLFNPLFFILYSSSFILHTLFFILYSSILHSSSYPVCRNSMAQMIGRERLHHGALVYCCFNAGCNWNSSTATNNIQV